MTFVVLQYFEQRVTINGYTVMPISVYALQRDAELDK